MGTCYLSNNRVAEDVGYNNFYFVSIVKYLFICVQVIINTN